MRWIAGSVLLSLALASSSDASTAFDRAQAYLKARGYLLYQQSTVPEANSSPQNLILGEAVSARVANRSDEGAGLLADLDLASIDARGRRARALGETKVRATDDEAFLRAQLVLSRPGPLALNPATRADADQQYFGALDTRVPGVLDNALALQGIGAQRRALGVSLLPDDQATDAILFLLEFQNPDGSWPADRDAHGVAGSGDVFVTSEVVFALDAYEAEGWSTANPGVGFSVDLPAALTNATNYLVAALVSSPTERAARVIALLERNSTLPVIATDIDTCILRQNQTTLPSDGSLSHFPFRTALFARALLRGSAHSAFAFDTDGDATSDLADVDIDGDNVSNALDLFPLHNDEWADSDNDGLGDNGDNDDDGDGVPDASEASYAGNAQETRDSDADGIPDTADPDDDNDGLLDTAELIARSDTTVKDTDGDSFSDLIEVSRNTKPFDPTDRPPPDGDIFPLGAPDTVVDSRDALLALRIAAKLETVPSPAQVVFERHAEVAPIVGGEPVTFDSADAVLIVRLAAGIPLQ